MFQYWIPSWRGCTVYFALYSRSSNCVQEEENKLIKLREEYQGLIISVNKSQCTTIGRRLTDLLSVEDETDLRMTIHTCKYLLKKQ